MVTKRVTFDLEEDIAKKLKLKVVKEGVTQKKFITDLIVKELEKDVE